MITQLTIENYKSIQDLTLDVGRVNVLIGENGCGKSNILEAITFAAAAEADRLDKSSLNNKGIRVTEPELMRSAFENNSKSNNHIIIALTFLNGSNLYTLENDNTPYSEWVHIERNLMKHMSESLQRENLIKFESEQKKLSMKSLSDIENYVNNLTKNPTEYSEQERSFLAFKLLQGLLNNPREIKDFIIYSPENTSLRNFSERAYPLGYKGEGLLDLLIYTQDDAKQSQDFTELNDIQEALELFGWFETIKIPDDFSPLEKKITIKDRYLEMPFDQRSANEGFLLVLFYITLVVSKYTPKIFAIDNIDTSLNPKLCSKLIEEIARLAKKYDKQIFLTSHNPAILDGIDLGDEEQRLIVVYRDDEGKTCCDTLDLKDKPKSATKARLLRLFKDNPIICQKIEETFNNSEEPLKLSEAFLRGYLGGLPTGF
jgi:predicted ATPase